MLRQHLGSSVRYEFGSIYDLDPNILGRFDIVLCFGVFYHLRYPMLGLDNLRRVCRGRLFFETACIDHALIVEGRSEELVTKDKRLSKLALMQFYRTDEFNRDPSNWFSPNLEAVVQMLTSAGFAVEHAREMGVRAVARASIASGLPEFLRIGSGEGVYYDLFTRKLLGDPPI